MDMQFLAAISHGTVNSVETKFRQLSYTKKTIVVLGKNYWSLSNANNWRNAGMPIRTIVDFENVIKEQDADLEVISFDDLSPEKHICIVCTDYLAAVDIEKNLRQRGIEYIG